jgi:hypothetical protein
MASFQDRVIGALKLQASTFEEVEHDATSMNQAAIVVVAAAVSSALSLIFYPLISMTAVIFNMVFAIIGWVVGAFLIWIIGTKVIPGKNTQADIVQVMRPVGFAQAPGLFAILAMIPILGVLVRLAIVVWTIVATVIAVRCALDYDDNVKPAIVCILAWVAAFVVAMILGGIVGLGSMGARMF